MRRRCCEETDRARQPRTDELSMHQAGDPNTVSQLLTQIRAREGPSQALFENSENLTSSSRGMRPEFSGETIVPETEVRREPQSSSLTVPRFQSGGGVLTIRPEIISNDVGFFLELITRFEFDFCLCDFFFERFEFLVCSNFNHICSETVHVPVLWPVCAHTIRIRMWLCP